ncbi:hypothetical protein BGX29_006151 [Mortierella sp. GBA35]|nr:hypothetical protein BGX29_006151 [Mortierella sp. GBA35]
MYPSLQISSTSSKNPHDLAGPFSIRLLLKDGISAEAEAETAAHNESKRAGLMDAQSEFSVSLPLSPVYRYRMHYGSSIENIENMGKAPHYPDHPTPAAAATASAAAPACASFSSDDPVEVQYIQELDKEMAQASIRVTKKRLSKRFHLNLNGCSHPSASTVSSTPSSPVSVVRCKTSRGTYDASNPSTPTTPTSTRSFLSSMPLKSPTFSQLFSTKVAPSRQASPKPFSRPESFHNLQGHQGPIMLTKEHIEHIRRIESRLCVLEKSVPRPEQHHRDVKQDQPPSPQHQLQHTVHDHPTTPHQLTTTDNTDYIQQQQLRTKRSSIRRIGAGGSDLRTSHVQRRISAIDRTDCQSPPGFFNCVPQSYSFHDWSTIGWDRPISAGAGIQEPSSSLLSRQQEHPFDDQSDRTEQEQVKERVVSRMRLESALWEIEALLRQYETLVVQDWGLKFDHLYNERRVVRNPQELPA